MAESLMLKSARPSTWAVSIMTIAARLKPATQRQRILGFRGTTCISFSLNKFTCGEREVQLVCRKVNAQKSRKIGLAEQIINLCLPDLGVKKVGLRNAVGLAFYSQFFHAVPQRVRMHAKSFGGAVRALDYAVSLL